MTEFPAGPQDEPGPVPPQPYGQPYQPPYAQPYGAQPYAQPAAQPYGVQPYQPQPYAPPPAWGAPPGYAAPGAHAMYADPGAPYGRDPLTGMPLSDKSKVAAGLLQLFFGTLGVGRFYTGHIGIAVAQLVVTIVGWFTTILGVGFVLIAGVGIWALVDAIVLLAGRSTDARGLVLRS
jgi:TM2 domain-containing membrane protein YozV